MKAIIHTIIRFFIVDRYTASPLGISIYGR